MGVMLCILESIYKEAHFVKKNPDFFGILVQKTVNRLQMARILKKKWVD